MKNRRDMLIAACADALSDDVMHRLESVCTSDEYVAQVRAKLVKWQARLNEILENDQATPRLQQHRIRLVTAEITELKIEILKAVIALKHQQPS